MLCGISYEPKILEELEKWKGSIQAARRFYDCEPYTYPDRLDRPTIRAYLESFLKNDPELYQTAVDYLSNDINISALIERLHSNKDPETIAQKNA